MNETKLKASNALFSESENDRLKQVLDGAMIIFGTGATTVCQAMITNLTDYGTTLDKIERFAWWATFAQGSEHCHTVDDWVSLYEIKQH